MNITQWRMPTNQAERDTALFDLFQNSADQHHRRLLPEFRGGRAKALEKLSLIQAKQYGESRNFLDGSVTHLSPYLRHGCITLPEAVDFVCNQFGLSAEKLLFEFGWREYWRNVWYAQGMQIFHDMAAPKVLLEFNQLPEDVLINSTGLPCMDGFITALAETGYLHNHARMWLDSYLVHWRKTDWKLAADWMHNQLLDGDYASNHLSWQWIASTFSHKPYFFNQENLAKYTHHQYCHTCTAQCPFRDSYSNLEIKLFQPTEQSPRRASDFIPVLPTHQSGDKTIIWVHDEMLNPNHPLMSLPHEKVFIFSPDYYKNWSILRLQFIADCLAELSDVSIWIGEPIEVFRSLNVYKILTQETPNHTLKNQASGYLIDWTSEKRISSAAKAGLESISSFSRFWKIAKHDFLKS